MNLQKLRAVLDEAEYSSLSDDAALAKVNDPTQTLTKESRHNAVSLMAALGSTKGAEILDSIEAAAPSSSPVKWALKALENPDPALGIDVGHPETRGMLDLLLSSENAALVKGLADYLVSRAQQEGLGVVKLGHIEMARAL